MKTKSKTKGLAGLMRKASSNLIPLNALIELTYKCNLSCKYCYIKPEKRRELQTQDIKKILNQLAEAGTLYLTLSGGEVFHRSDIIEILTHAKEKNFAVTIFSNGTLIGDKIAYDLSFLGIQEIGITLWGALSRTHDRITGIPGSFLQSLEAIKRLRNRSINVLVKCTLTRDNFHEYSDLIRLAQKLSCKFTFDPIVTSPVGEPQKNTGHRITKEELKTIYSDKRINSDVKHKSQKVNNFSPACDAGRNFLTISAYGDVFPCVQLPVKIGNILESPFKKIWNSEKFSDFRAEVQKVSSACSACRFFYGCTRCPGLAMMEEGDIKGPSKAACMTAEAVDELKKITQNLKRKTQN